MTTPPGAASVLAGHQNASMLEPFPWRWGSSTNPTQQRPGHHNQRMTDTPGATKGNSQPWPNTAGPGHRLGSLHDTSEGVLVIVDVSHFRRNGRIGRGLRREPPTSSGKHHPRTCCSPFERVGPHSTSFGRGGLHGWYGRMHLFHDAPSSSASCCVASAARLATAHNLQPGGLGKCRSSEEILTDTVGLG